MQCGCLWALHRLYQGRCRLFYSEESGYMRLHHSGSTRKSRISLDQQGGRVFLKVGVLVQRPRGPEHHDVFVEYE